MPEVEVKEIPCDTLLQTSGVLSQGNNTLLIFIFPENDFVGINGWECGILYASLPFFQNSVPIGEGDLFFMLRNALKDIDFEINDEGELLVHAEDAENYRIDSEGTLYYDYR